MEQKNSGRELNRGDFWKNLLFHNLGIKLLSCVGAILAWLLVTNIADPYKEKVFTVPVETVNEDAISSANMVYEIVEGNMASVTVGGKRSVIDKLNGEDFVAIADLSELSSVNAVPIKARMRGSNPNDVVVECNQVLKISLENKDTKQMKVSISTSGEPGSDYSVGECVAKPNVIEVTGGESVIERIDSVGVTVNVSGATENFSQKLIPVAYDKKGKKISSSTLSFNVHDVRVRVKLLQKKTVPVKVEIKGQPAEGYEFVDVSNSPEEIEVAGSKKLLQEISQIVLPVDISNLIDTSAALEQNINVEEHLPAGISIPAEEERNISVKILIEKQQTRKMQMPISQIKLSNMLEGYVGEIIADQPDLQVEIRGRESVIYALSGEVLTGSVDCGERSEGTYSLPLKLNLGDSCSMAKDLYVRVRISKKKEDVTRETSTPAVTQTPEPEATTTPGPTDAD